MNESSSTTGPESHARRWHPLAAVERRLLGVLVEKAKTTPDAYPLSINALRTGSNQKSNRFPQMELDIDQVEATVERLRGIGAVTEVQSDGRVPKFRHQMYAWMGVEKVELAVMAELLLRGAQTVGELRGRAARMEPIADLAALQPVLASLEEKNLIVYLTPRGRGCVVTHNLYQPQELDKLRAQYSPSHLAQQEPSAHAVRFDAPVAGREQSALTAGESSSFSGGTASDNNVTSIASPRPSDKDNADVRAEVARLADELCTQREQLASLKSDVQRQLQSLQSDVEAIKRDLGL